MACKEGQFDVVEVMVNDQFKTFSINLNAQHVNGMTPFDLAVHRYVRLLDTLEYSEGEEKGEKGFFSFQAKINFFLYSRPGGE